MYKVGCSKTAKRLLVDSNAQWIPTYVMQF